MLTATGRDRIIRDVRLFRSKRDGYFYVQLSRTRKKSLKTQDEEEAGLKFHALKREILNRKVEELEQGKRVSLSRFRDSYLNERGNYSPDTLRADKLAFQKLIEHFGESTLLVSLTPDKISAWKADLLRFVSPGSVKTWTRHLSAAFSLAVEYGYTRKNPFRVRKRGPYGTMHDGHLKQNLLKMSPPYVSPADFDKIMEREPDPDFKRFFRILFFTGMRRRELVRMKWAQVEPQALRIVGKGGRPRHFPLTEEIRALLGDPGKPGEYVFPRWRDPNTITRRFRKAVVAAGIPGVTPHVLRHSFSTRLAMAGLGPDERMPLMGHTTKEMAAHYTHVTRQHLLDALDRCAATAPHRVETVEKKGVAD